MRFPSSFASLGSVVRPTPARLANSTSPSRSDAATGRTTTIMKYRLPNSSTFAGTRRVIGRSRSCDFAGRKFVQERRAEPGPLDQAAEQDVFTFAVQVPAHGPEGIDDRYPGGGELVAVARPAAGS